MGESLDKKGMAAGATAAVVIGAVSLVLLLSLASVSGVSALSKPKEDFESVDDWTFEGNHDICDGSQTDDWRSEGNYSYRINCAAAGMPGQEYGGIKKEFDFTDVDNVIVDIRLKQYTGYASPSNLQAQVLIGDDVVWSCPYPHGARLAYYMNTVIDTSQYTGVQSLMFRWFCTLESRDSYIGSDILADYYIDHLRTGDETEPPIPLPELSICPSRLELHLDARAHLTAALTYCDAPLAGKVINWSATSGGFETTSDVTDSSGQDSVIYIAPKVTIPTSVTITASFAGDDEYQPISRNLSCTIFPAQAPEIIMDIEPDTLQIGSENEWVTCYIEFPNSDVRLIDVSSILLEETIPVDSTAPTEIGDYDNDGIPDLMVKFDQLSVENVVAPGLSTLTVTVTGCVDNSDVTSSEWRFTDSETIDVIQVSPTSRPPGSLISVRREGPYTEPTVRTEIYSFTLDLATEVSEELIEVAVGSETSEGQTIIVNIDNDVLPLESLNEIEVLFDNRKIEVADNYEDILNPTDENDPEYLVILGAEGIQVLISIPHFSVHTITIGKAATEATPLFWVIAAAAIALLTIFGLAWGYRFVQRKQVSG